MFSWITSQGFLASLHHKVFSLAGYRSQMTVMEGDPYCLTREPQHIDPSPEASAAWKPQAIQMALMCQVRSSTLVYLQFILLLSLSLRTT